MRVAILTSHETRHRYFVRKLCECFDVVAVGYEQTGYTPSEVVADDLTPEEQGIVDHHFAERQRQEQSFLGLWSEFLPNTDECSVKIIEPGTLNSPAMLAFLEKAATDTVAVYGTNLVKPPLLDRYAGRIINMHLGLSPYYRGTATNFYPLLNEEPEYVGATIHLIDAGIDSGPILRHARPEIVPDDMPHTIGCKAIMVGVEAMCSALADWDAGLIEPVPQWRVENPRVYLRKDYHPRQVVELYRKLQAGLIPSHVNRAASVVNNLRLVE